MRSFTVILILMLNISQSFSQNGLFGLANDDLQKQQSIKIQYGNQTIRMHQKSTKFDNLRQRRESNYVSEKLPPLEIKVLSEVTYANNNPTLQHQIELSSDKKLEQDLTIYFPVKTLENFDELLMPLKNGIIYSSEYNGDAKIASYRSAGKSEKYLQDLALPLIICKNGMKGIAVLTDPYFTSLYNKGNIQWTYPKEVGFEDFVEKRTIIEMAGVLDLDMGMNMYYQTILKDVPAGPDWMKDIAMISYDFMSDDGKGWYADIDTLTTLLPLADRQKVALCMHGWYDYVGKYCFNFKTGKWMGNHGV
jgi:hypothetical protein